MDQQPKIPTLKDAQKPQVKIKGLGAGLTLLDRLKQFKKKDLAFILAGLGTLFMAPLAEHFMMAPENGDAGQMAAGWGGKGNDKLFGNGSSPYETSGGMANGGPATSSGGDIITPLNVRDPSALVMGPGAAQQPPAGSAAPAATPPPTAPARSDEDLKDALKGAAARGASAAVKHAALPVPKVALGGSGLRGLGAASGASSAGASLAAPGAAAGSNGAGGGGSLGLARGGSGYKGVAGPRGPSNPTGLDNTKKAGANAGDAFNRTGNALAALNGAAGEQIPTGGSGFNGGGAGGSGSNDKGPGGNGAGGSKSVGESLAFIAAKERMMKDLELEFEKRKLNDPELLWGQIRNDALKTIGGELAKAMAKDVVGLHDLLVPSSKSAKTIKCPGLPDVPEASARKCADEKDFTCYRVSGGGNYSWISTSGSAGVACQVTGGDGKDGPGGTTDGDGVSGVQQVAAIRDLGKVCGEIPATADPKNPIDTYLTTKMKPAAQKADVSRKILEGGDLTCGGAMPSGVDGTKNAADLIAAVKGALSTKADEPKTPPDPNAAQGGALQLIQSALPAGTDDGVVKTQAAVFVQADKDLTEALRLIKAAQDNVGPALAAPTKDDSGGSVPDSKAVARAQQVTSSQKAVGDQAKVLNDAATGLQAKVKAMTTDISDVNGKGSAADVVRYNKALAGYPEAAPDAATDVPAVTAAGPEAVKPKIDATKAKLDALKALVPLKPNKDDEGAKTNYKAARDGAVTAIGEARTEAGNVVKGFIDYTDGVKVSKILR